MTEVLLMLGDLALAVAAVLLIRLIRAITRQQAASHLASNQRA